MRILLIVAFVLPVVFLFGQEKADPDPKRFQGEIDAFKKWDSKNAIPDNPILFIGSSSIRMWKTHEAFPSQPVVNRGFGGAHISDMLFYYHEIAKLYQPEVIVFYCGDNDIAFGKTVEQVYADLLQLTDSLAADFPGAHFIFLPAKPCLNRWSVWPKMQQFNKKAAALCSSNKLYHYLDTATPLLGQDGKPNPTLFIDDALHLNDKGYELWTRILGNLLEKIKPR